MGIFSKKKEVVEEQMSTINDLLKENDVPLEVKPKREKFENVQAKYVSETLEDGETVIEVEPAVEVGAAVLVEVEGEMVAVPDGEYILLDGRTLTVMGGIVESIQDAAEAEEEAVEEEEMSETPKEDREPKVVTESTVVEKKFSEEDFENLKKEVEELTKLNDFLKSENEHLVGEFNELKKNLSESFSSLNETIKEVFAETKDEPIKKHKNPLKSEPKKNIFLREAKIK